MTKKQTAVKVTKNSHGEIINSKVTVDKTRTAVNPIIHNAKIASYTVINLGNRGRKVGITTVSGNKFVHTHLFAPKKKGAHLSKSISECINSATRLLVKIQSARQVNLQHWKRIQTK